MKKYEMIIASSLEKILPEQLLSFDPIDTLFTCLKGETFSFQIACKSNEPYKHVMSIKTTSPISEHITLKTVELVPTALATYGNVDDNYLFTTPRLVPDVLRDLDNGGTIDLHSCLWQSIWVDVDVCGCIEAGTYPIEFSMLDNNNEEVCTTCTSITIYNTVLPKQDLIHTEWFHTDCIADYYNVHVFSEPHWKAIENFIMTAVKHSINMILTPIFTPPLDTAVGGERTTVQLIDVNVDNGVYSFDYSKFERWVSICKRQGVEYYEMAHLFSQWGAKYAPKIMAMVDGEYKQLFGWDTDGTGSEYTEFLQVYLPALIIKLNELGIAKATYFHISDEPGLDDIENYKAALSIVEPILKDFTIIDALSDYEFYKTGAVKRPIPANNHITPFIENEVPNLWTYYCCGQHIDVSNRFMSMPSARNRIIGTQMYKYNIEGFLHWGYNFYNSQYSINHINPYFNTDAGRGFPSGDSFMVYPKDDYTAEASIRLMVFYQAVCDMRAFKLLESLTSREYVLDLIDGELSKEITFFEYPKSASYLIDLRNKVNKEIDNHC